MLEKRRFAEEGLKNVQQGSIYPVPDFPDFTVSKNGVFVNTVTGNELKIWPTPTGTMKVNFRVGGKVYSRSAAKIVCLVFNGEPDDPNHVVFYKDLNYKNIDADNLAWRDRSFVIEYSMQMKRTGPLRPYPIKKESTGEIFANSLEAAMATGGIEKYILTAANNYDTFYQGSRWSVPNVVRTV